MLLAYNVFGEETPWICSHRKAVHERVFTDSTHPGNKIIMLSVDISKLNVWLDSQPLYPSPL